MPFALKRTYGGRGFYVAMPGSPKSYTPTLDRAQLFDTLDAATDNACGNERPVRVGAP